MSQLPKAVSFDLDGTLYSTRRAAWRMVFGMLGRLRFLATYRQVRNGIRNNVYEDGPALIKAEVEGLAAALELDYETAQKKLRQIHDVELAKILGKVGPFPESKALLSGLIEKGVPVAILSDLPVAAKLSALGLDTLDYSITLDASDTGALKPHARSFEKVAHSMGVELSDLVHVGDRHDTDVTGAERCGAQAVWLKSNPNHAVLERTVIVSSLAELGELWGIPV